VYTGTSNVLHAFGSSGNKITSWTAAPGNVTAIVVDDEGPKKKRKVEGDGHGKEKKKKEGGGKPSLNAITKILAVKNGEFVLVVTNDDKAVTVLSAERLGVLSVRCVVLLRAMDVRPIDVVGWQTSSEKSCRPRLRGEDGDDPVRG